MGFSYNKVKQFNKVFLLYCLILFGYELSLLITSTLHLGNHLIANINSLVYSCLVLGLVLHIYKKYNSKIGSVTLFMLTIIITVSIGWIMENFTFGNTVLIYNSVLSGVVSVVITLICIYILNVLILTKTGNSLKDPDVLIIAGILTRSLTFGFSLWFLNFDYGFDWNFLSNLLTGINIGLCLSDMFFLYAVTRMITQEIWVKK
jgi:hypothetical protein